MNKKTPKDTEQIQFFFDNNHNKDSYTKMEPASEYTEITPDYEDQLKLNSEALDQAVKEAENRVNKIKEEKAQQIVNSPKNIEEQNAFKASVEQKKQNKNSQKPETQKAIKKAKLKAQKDAKNLAKTRKATHTKGFKDALKETLRTVKRNSSSLIPNKATKRKRSL